MVQHPEIKARTVFEKLKTMTWGQIAWQLTYRGSHLGERPASASIRDAQLSIM